MNSATETENGIGVANETKTVTLKLCDVCTENAAKYRCPRCGKRTCSVQCVKTHKATDDCNGKQNKTAYVSIKKFKDTNLLSDYCFLEDATRKSQGCQKDYLKLRHDKPKILMKLIRHAESQGIELRTMPYPMSKRKNNRTFFLFRSKEILWQIEWIFPHADTTYIDRKLIQTSTLESLLEKYLDPSQADPVVCHRLRQYVKAGLTGCRLLMKVEGLPSNDVRYYVLDPSKSITENLCGKCIVEYPTILIILQTDLQTYKVMSKDEEDQLWRERRKEKFSRQQKPYQRPPADEKSSQDTLNPPVLPITASPGHGTHPEDVLPSNPGQAGGHEMDCTVPGKTASPGYGIGPEDVLPSDPGHEMDCTVPGNTASPGHGTGPKGVLSSNPGQAGAHEMDCTVTGNAQIQPSAASPEQGTASELLDDSSSSSQGPEEVSSKPGQDGEQGIKSISDENSHVNPGTASYGQRTDSELPVG